MALDDPPLDHLIEAILDETSIDWPVTDPDDGTGRRVSHLRIVAAVAQAHRQQRRDRTRDVSTGLQPPAMWGHLRVAERVGRGAYGEVFRAWDTRLDREVALKLISPLSDAVLGNGSSLVEEGCLLARVRHPNVVTIYGADRIEGSIGLWMEFVPGRTLEELLRAGRMFEPAEVARIGLDLARALSAVHAAGLIHRDVKAQNVMLADDGRVLLMDFGSGRHLVDEESDATGTPLYLAPEVFKGRPATAQSDIYGLGVLLYHLLTTGYPVQGATIRELRLAHERQTRTPLEAVRRDVPSSIARIVGRALEPRPEHRYATADDLRSELESVTGAPQRRRWYSAAAASLLVVAVVAGSLGWLVRPRSPARLEVVGSHRQLTGADRLEISPAFSPDGRTIAYTAARMPGEAQVVVQSVPAGAAESTASAATTLSPAPRVKNQPRWSPDAESLLYITPEGVFIESASAGSPQLIVAAAAGAVKGTAVATMSGISAAAWSPDGGRIVVADNSDRTLSIVTLADGRRHTIATAPNVLHSCDWSPDARWIACTLGNWHTFVGAGWVLGNIAQSAIVIVPSEGGTLTHISSGVSMDQSPVWSADSRRLYFVSNRLGPFGIFSQEIGEDGRARGEPIPQLQGLDAYSIAFSRDRTRLAYTKTFWRANIFKVPIPTSGVARADSAEPVTTGNQVIESMRVSGSGRWLLYDSNINGNFDIFRVPIDGGQPEQLTAEPFDEFAPDLTHDDSILAYHSFRGGTSRDVFTRTLDTGLATQVTNSPFEESYAAWVPGRNALVFWDQFLDRGVPRGLFITRRAADGTWSASPERLTAGTWNVSIDPGGRFLATTRDGAVEVMDLDSRESHTAYTHASDAVHPPAARVLVGDDGRTLFFKTFHGGSKIWSVPVSGGPAQVLLEFGTTPSPRTDFAAGGGYFFFTIDDQRSNVYVVDVEEH